MIVGTIRILPPPNRRAEVLEVLRAVQGPVLARPGCASFRSHEEGAKRAVVFMADRGVREAQFHHRILGAVELSGGTPETGLPPDSK